jgi:hypothetical protein
MVQDSKLLTTIVAKHVTILVYDLFTNLQLYRDLNFNYLFVIYDLITNLEIPELPEIGEVVE